MRERLILLFATGLGAGRSPVAPGTVGSIVGLGYWWLLVQLHSDYLYWLTFVAVAAFAVWCGGEAAKIIHHNDPPCVVIDEICVVPLALAGLGTVWWMVVVAFVLFRVFDIWKPRPIRQVERWPGGVGIVADDVLAALYACAATHGVAWLVGLARR
ncbi:MAG: phosphatidylglycerophosphatase A [Verrucomicrobiia bacterium]